MILFFILLFAETLAVPQAVRRPHILFTVVDDLGWNDVGWNDQFGQIRTPKLDKLRSESITLEQHYVYRFCSPSRSTMMTGRYPWHLGQHTEMNLNPTPGIACGINRNYTFIPQLLKEQAGYTTWALGKWHLGFQSKAYTPTYRGFDRFLGYYAGAEEHFTHLKGGYPVPPGSKASIYNAYDLANNTGTHVAPCLGPVGNGSATYSSYLYGNETLRLLENHDPSDPLYVYLAWNNVHDPYEAPAEYLAHHRHIKNKERQTLAAMMNAIDDQLTAIVDAYKAKGMWDDTIFVLISDNGGALSFGHDPSWGGNNWPLRGGKYTFWQGGVRSIALVGGGANIIPKNRRGAKWNGAMHVADWYPTFASLAGVANPSLGTGNVPVDGVDVWDAIINDRPSPRMDIPLQIISNSAGNAYTRPAGSCESFPQSTDKGALCTPPIRTMPSTHTPSEGMGTLTTNRSHSTPWQSEHPQSTATTSTPSLLCGALIQGKWKLIMGYPGWIPAWDGWIQPPHANGSQALKDEFVHRRQGTLCVQSPCLFDIESDPNEHHNVAADHPKVVSALKERIFEHLATEVTLEDSGLCPTEYYYGLDPRGTAMAVATGFWQPWIED